MNVDGRYLILMCIFYLITIGVETPVLLVGLSRRHPIRHRVFAGVWLTACTYPIVWLVLPALIDPRENEVLYLTVAETFAPVAECVLFWLMFGKAKPRTQYAFWRDMITITVANLASFGVGKLITLNTNPWEWVR
jgi:hypothetical protein